MYNVHLTHSLLCFEFVEFTLFRVRYLEDDLRAKRETDIISYRPQIVFAQVKQANPCNTFLFLLNC